MTENHDMRQININTDIYWVKRDFRLRRTQICLRVILPPQPVLKAGDFRVIPFPHRTLGK